MQKFLQAIGVLAIGTFLMAASAGVVVEVARSTSAGYGGGVTKSYVDLLSCPADGGVLVALAGAQEIVVANGTATANVRLWPADRGAALGPDAGVQVKAEGVLIGSVSGADATTWNTKAGSNVWRCGSSGAAETVTLVGVQ